jgi:hypothetical protein
MESKTTSKSLEPGPDKSVDTPRTASIPCDVLARNVAELEARVEQLFGPDSYSQDAFWDRLAYNAGTYWLLAPLRDELQALAARYRDQPLLFWKKYRIIVTRHKQKLLKNPSQQEGVRWFDDFRQRIHNGQGVVTDTGDKENAGPGLGSSLRFSRAHGQKQLAAANALVSVLAQPIEGSSLRSLDIEKLAKSVLRLIARGSGATRLSVYDKAYSLRKRGMRAHAICERLNIDNYNQRSASERKEIRSKTLEACRYREKTAIPATN